MIQILAIKIYKTQRVKIFSANRTLHKILKGKEIHEKLAKRYQIKIGDNVLNKFFINSITFFLNFYSSFSATVLLFVKQIKFFK